MAWVNPTTWVDASQVTKSQFNDWNASMLAAGDHGGWSTWAAELYVQSTLSPANLGGSMNCRKLKVGQLALCAFDFAASATGAGPYQAAGARLPVNLSLPWTPSPSARGSGCGYAYLFDEGLDNMWLMAARLSTGVSSATFRFTSTGNSTSPAWLSHGRPLVDVDDWALARFSGLIAYRTAT